MPALGHPPARELHLALVERWLDLEQQQSLSTSRILGMKAHVSGGARRVSRSGLQQIGVNQTSSGRHCLPRSRPGRPASGKPRASVCDHVQDDRDRERDHRRGPQPPARPRPLSLGNHARDRDDHADDRDRCEQHREHPQHLLIPSRRSWGAHPEQPQIARDRLGPVGDVEFAQDAVDVELHGAVVNRLPGDDSAEVWVKLEAANPTGWHPPHRGGRHRVVATAAGA